MENNPQVLEYSSVGGSSLWLKLWLKHSPATFFLWTGRCCLCPQGSSQICRLGRCCLYPLEVSFGNSVVGQGTVSFTFNVSTSARQEITTYCWRRTVSYLQLHRTGGFSISFCCDKSLASVHATDECTLIFTFSHVFSLENG